MWPCVSRTASTANKRCGHYAVFLLLALVLKFNSPWYSLLQGDAECEHRELDGGKTGLKVIVAAFAKSGTRTIAHSLNYIGLRTDHSEDFDGKAYKAYSLVMRTKEEYKNMGQGEIMSPVWYDPWARDTLMRKISRCRIDGIALDGHERLFWPLYHASPDVKVIIMDWRTFDEMDRSIRTYACRLATMVANHVITDAMAHLLPWGLVVKYVDKYLYNGTWLDTAKEGGPPVTEVNGPLGFYYHGHFAFDFHVSTFFPMAPFGVSEIPVSESHYLSWFQAVQEGVPKERLLALDPRKSNYEDLCRFLDIDPCPRKGRIRKARNSWLWERDFPLSSFVQGTIRFFETWCNWKIFWGAKRLFWRTFSNLWRKAKTA